MTGPRVAPLLRCSSCSSDFLPLWCGLDTPAGPGRAAVSGECYWCSKLAAMANGGLPVARPPQVPVLDQLLARWDRADEIAWARWRGLRDLIGDEDVALLEATRR